MSSIEIFVRNEDTGGEVYLEITGGTMKDNGTFTILDAEAADLLEDILRARRPGSYQFGPLELNG